MRYILSFIALMFLSWLVTADYLLATYRTNVNEFWVAVALYVLSVLFVLTWIAIAARDKQPN